MYTYRLPTQCDGRRAPASHSVRRQTRAGIAQQGDQLAGVGALQVRDEVARGFGAQAEDAADPVLERLGGAAVDAGRGLAESWSPEADQYAIGRYECLGMAVVLPASVQPRRRRTDVVDERSVIRAERPREAEREDEAKLGAQEERPDDAEQARVEHRDDEEADNNSASSAAPATRTHLFCAKASGSVVLR